MMSDRGLFLGRPDAAVTAAAVVAAAGVAPAAVVAAVPAALLSVENGVVPPS
jgi:hypothetical protein